MASAPSDIPENAFRLAKASGRCQSMMSQMKDETKCMGAVFSGYPTALWLEYEVSPQPMSGTLKERLKKARASSQPFCSVVKRIKVENEENDQTLSEPGESSKEENCSKAQESLENKDNEPEKESSEDKNTSESKSLDTGSSSVLQKDSTEKTIKQTLKEEKAKLTRQVQEKEDLLRRLKLVKMYRIKNDVTELEDLIKKWRRCGQRLLCELQSIMSEDEDEKLTLTELIDYYGIDDKLLHYNRTEEEFTGV
uniref:Swi5-dependent recombination DNA repair protein 1 homolog n=1 Tax=Rattus norvegicus TaxID=10116 RepID=SFR1_RAT|nr:RecName: Full=Swi5-dependent recombination DNA repair protein 1 homolog; AltName: Full=Liver regeneration-related protein LRRGT00030; AltName: Full=Meiosis protein 5 homolog [Rattus norvegicus]AAQ96243.1 LRRGT00030 [Rattus norvegicus]